MNLGTFPKRMELRINKPKLSKIDQNQRSPLYLVPDDKKKTSLMCYPNFFGPE